MCGNKRRICNLILGFKGLNNDRLGKRPDCRVEDLADVSQGDKEEGRVGFVTFLSPSRFTQKQNCD